MAADLTDARRARSLELFGYTSKTAAKKLLDEGYGGPVPRPKAAYLVALDSMRRQFDRDREFWRTKWRADRETAKEAPDDPIDREEFIAGLESIQGQVEEALDDRNLKGTPRVQALGELRQIRQAIGKARGVDAVSAAERGGDDSPIGEPVTVLVLDLSKCDEETQETYGRRG